MLSFVYRFAISLLFIVGADTALAELLDIDISILDSESFALDAPTGDTRWVIEGAPDFLLAEQHGALSSMRYDLPPGDYRVTVWELNSSAAAEQTVTLPADGTANVALTLSTMNSGLIDDTLARTNEPDANALAAPGREPQQFQDTRELTSVRPFVLTVGAGDIFGVALPDIVDRANDMVALSDGEPGWLWSAGRGSLDVMGVKAPDTAGKYTAQYIQVPEMTLLLELEILVR